MREGHRLAELANSLFEDWQSGALSARARDVSEDDAASIARILHAEMDIGTAARDAQAEKNGMTVACQPGCAHCCETLVFVFEGEAIAIAQWLSEPENTDALDWFRQSYPGWREQVGDVPEKARFALYRDQRAQFEAAIKEVWHARVMCAFNRDGACTIYPVRPNYCRNCHALETSERCVATSDQPPQALHFVPIEDFMRRAKPLSEAVHVALGKAPGAPSALCAQVHELLADGDRRRKRRALPNDKVGRNDPCPCQSGKKFKRCCGA